MHYSNLIGIIKKRRESLRITQQDLAQTAEVGLRTLKQFESGKGNPTLETLEKLAGAMGMEVTLQIKKSDR